jgi:YegS/Rv2252/BmrU family lipid kinase
MNRRKIHLIANPGAGQTGLNLKQLNTIFAEADVDWELSLTRQAGDARRLAAAAAQAGADVVAIFGGDGSVAEAAAGLLGVTTPLAIVPGCTANVLAVELGIPMEIEAALRLAVDPAAAVRTVDMAAVNEHFFCLRVGIGFEAAMVEGAGRAAKDRFGVFAYLFSALQTLSTPVVSRYQLVVDGQPVTAEGVACFIANSGSLGQPGMSLIPGIDVADGKLDVVVIPQANFATFTALLATIWGRRELQPEDLSNQYNELGVQAGRALQYWQAGEVSVTADPPQRVQADGELLGEVAVTCRVLPGALQVLVPRQGSTAST